MKLGKMIEVKIKESIWKQQAYERDRASH